MEIFLLGLALCVQVVGGKHRLSPVHFNVSCSRSHLGIVNCYRKESTSISEEIYCYRCSNDEERYVCNLCGKRYHKKVYSKNVEDNFQLFLSGKYEPWKDIKIYWKIK